ncbi:MAG: hypothetical protein P0S95_00005 [Rhabdochlamydiaceae bacterium]|nr:hypothetical protein [Candidatus Amphrikana amoebophyrae]
MNQYDGPIVDTHMHLWDYNNDIPWLSKKGKKEHFFEPLIGNYDRLRRDYKIEDYLIAAKKHHITKSVHIEVGNFSPNYIKETNWIDSIAKNNLLPNAIVGSIDFCSEDVEKTLKGHAKSKYFRGVRQALNYDSNPDFQIVNENLFENDIWRSNFKLLKEYNASFDLHIYSHQIKNGAQLAKDNPEVPIMSLFRK